MKTYVTYGFFMTLANFLVTLALYFLGYHSDPVKFQSISKVTQWIPLFISIAIIVLGVRARRSEVPATEEFGYGRALGAGVMISLFGCLFGTATNLLYFQVINPEVTNVIIQAQLNAMEAKGMSEAQLTQVEKGMRFMMSPGIAAAAGIFIGMFFCTIISLIVAAIVKRPATEESPAAV